MTHRPSPAPLENPQPPQVFCTELPRVTAQLREALRSGDHDTLRSAAHRLAGSAGVYGICEASAPAASLWARLNRENPPSAVKGESTLAEAVEELVLACERAAKVMATRP